MASTLTQTWLCGHVFGQLQSTLALDVRFDLRQWSVGSSPWLPDAQVSAYAVPQLYVLSFVRGCADVQDVDS